MNHSDSSQKQASFEWMHYGAENSTHTHTHTQPTADFRKNRWREVLMLATFFSVFGLKAQTTEKPLFQSAAADGVQAMFYKCSMIAEPSGSTYLAGATLNGSGNYDILLSKINSSGQVAWSQTWNGTGNGGDYAADFKADSGGNLIVTGTTQVTSANFDAVTLKFNASGTLLWDETYNGTASLLDGGPALLTVTDITGREVARQMVAAGVSNVEMDVRALSAGAYVLRMAGSGVEAVRRFVRE